LTRRVTTDAHGVVVALGQVLLRGDRSRYLFRRTVDSASLAPRERPQRQPIAEPSRWDPQERRRKR
jgi:hypothetical protein